MHQSFVLPTLNKTGLVELAEIFREAAQKMCSFDFPAGCCTAIEEVIAIRRPPVIDREHLLLSAANEVMQEFAPTYHEKYEDSARNGVQHSNAICDLGTFWWSVRSRYISLDEHIDLTDSERYSIAGEQIREERVMFLLFLASYVETIGED